MKITISGNLGSGKSTVAKMLAKDLGYSHYSTGDFMRKMAEERGITLLELGKIAENDSSIDYELDDYQKKLGEENDNFVLDARLGFHFLPDSKKIFLQVEEKVGAERIHRGLLKKEEGRENEGIKDDFEEVFKALKERRACERIRYEQFYGVDYEDLIQFDIIIDTTKITATETVLSIKEKL